MPRPTGSHTRHALEIRIHAFIMDAMIAGCRALSIVCYPIASIRHTAIMA